MRRVTGLAVLLLCCAAAPVRVTLPVNDAVFPSLGAGAPSPEAVNANCLSCHSVEMVMMQPKLTEAQWTATVKKMRTVMKAPIAESDEAAIIAWLTAWNGSPPAAAAAPAPAPPKPVPVAATPQARAAPKSGR